MPDTPRHAAPIARRGTGDACVAPTDTPTHAHRALTAEEV